MRVHQVCQNWQEDRIIPRMARALAERLGWGLSAAVDPAADVVYLTGYFEATRLGPWPTQPVAAYFTHREEEPPGNAKARLFDDVARRVQLRVVTCRMYGEAVRAYGPTVQASAPLERERFTLGPAQSGRLVAGFSGYTYSNHRKGEDLALRVVNCAAGQKVIWRASGRGWPVLTKRYSWAEMPSFYQGLDVLVVPSRVEGIPMPPLEALACGVSVVVPWHVGLLDELPGIPGIHRYERGNADDLVRVFAEAIETRSLVDREALREATARYSVEAWVEDHARAFDEAFWGDGYGDGSSVMLDAGIDAAVDLQMAASTELQMKRPMERDTGSSRGIYCVAFGEQAREAARRMMVSAKKHMPDVPICLCAATPIGPEDVFIAQPDSDVGGRRAKLRAYELAPAEWQAVLYLDADTEVIAPVYQLFQWVEDGWELVICKDISPNELLANMRTKVASPEAVATEAVTGTWDVLQFNGGVWAFRRGAQTEAFFSAWQREWERWAQRDQGALIRALYMHPLRVLVLGNEWNAFPRFQSNQKAAGILHYPGQARRWGGRIGGRLDAPEAWAAVRKFGGRR